MHNGWIPYPEPNKQPAALLSMVGIRFYEEFLKKSGNVDVPDTESWQVVCYGVADRLMCHKKGVFDPLDRYRHVAFPHYYRHVYPAFSASIRAYKHFADNERTADICKELSVPWKTRVSIEYRRWANAKAWMWML